MIVEIDGKEYEIKFTQEALRKFEEVHKVGILKYLKINIADPTAELDIQFSYVDELFKWGIYHANKQMSKEEIQKITSKWIERDGLLVVYTELVNELIFSLTGSEKKILNQNSTGQVM